MTPQSLNQFFLLYAWFPLAALLFFLLLIARFYEKFSGERTYFRLFLVPLVLFGLAAARGASVEQLNGDALSGLLSGSAGLLLLLLCGRLFRLMLRKHKRVDSRE